MMMNKEAEFLHRVHLFLSQFPFVIEGEDVVYYQIVKRRKNFFDLLKQSAQLVIDATSAREIEEREGELTNL